MVMEWMVGYGMEWIELKRSSPVQIHEPLILIQSNPADDPEYRVIQNKGTHLFSLPRPYLLTHRDDSSTKIFTDQCYFVGC